MCTVTWLQDGNGYLLLSNRDERPTRLPAIAPAIAGSAVRYIAPLDGDHGGSWIGVNELGLSVCLLNGAPPAAPAPDSAAFVSRGLVALHLLESSGGEEIRARIRELELPRFRPFTVVVVEPKTAPFLIGWSSDQQLSMSAGPLKMPLFSTVRTPAIEAREAHFAELIGERGRLAPELLYAFHRSHEPERGPLSVCMHAEFSNTVSLSQVKVNTESVELTYYPAPPCACDIAPFGTNAGRPSGDANTDLKVRGLAVSLPRRDSPI